MHIRFGLTSNIIKSYGLDTTFNITISTVFPCDFNESKFVFMAYLHYFSLKANHSWLVFIEDGHRALSVISLQFLTFFRFVNLYKEILIRLPNVIINDFNLNVDLFLMSSHFYHLFEFFIVIRLRSGAIIGSNVKIHILMHFLNDSNIYMSRRLSN